MNAAAFKTELRRQVSDQMEKERGAVDDAAAAIIRCGNRKRECERRVLELQERLEWIDALPDQ